MEDGTVMLVGATTENPSFELNARAPVARPVLVFKPLDAAAIEKLLARAEEIEGKHAAARCGGARIADRAWPTATAGGADARRGSLARRAKDEISTRRSCRRSCSGARRSTTSRRTATTI